MSKKLLLNSESLNDFLIIINAYGSFLKNREIVKDFDVDMKERNISIKQMLSDYESDPYSSYSREFGIDSGLSSHQRSEISNDILREFEKKKVKLTSQLISSEKFYKKLKHQFVEKYPEFKVELHDLIKKHQESFQSMKRRQHHNQQAVLELSDSFVSFFQKTFQKRSDKQHNYYDFCQNILKRSGFDFNSTRFEAIRRFLSLTKYSSENERSKREILTVSDMFFISEIMSLLFDNLKEDDFESVLGTIKSTETFEPLNQEKIVTHKIIFKNIEKYKILLSNFKKLYKVNEEIL